MRADDASSTVPQSIVVSQFREVDRSGAQGPSDESPPVTPSNLDGAVALIQLFGGALNLNIRTAFPSPTPRAGPLPARSFEEVGGSEIALRSQRVLTLGSKQAFEQEAVSDISAIVFSDQAMSVSGCLMRKLPADLFSSSGVGLESFPFRWQKPDFLLQV
jgi:hypothetical protein